MSAENSTASLTCSNITMAALDHVTKTAAFFDPVWHLAITIEYYFQHALLAIGVIGLASNALVLYALITHNAQQAKKHAINMLIIHQNSIDLTCCVLLLLTYCVGDRMHLTGSLGYFICAVFISNSALYSALHASVINLITITIERYLKIVHPFWSKKHLKRWMINAAMVFAWIAGIMFNVPVVISTMLLEDGLCRIYMTWATPEGQVIFGTSVIVIFFVVPLVVFIYCYGRIIIVMRRQMCVMAGHNVEAGGSQANASQIRSKRIKWNIAKTMLTVSVVFIISWCPNNIIYMISDHTSITSHLIIGYYPTVFMIYLNVCLNPFIYATKHEGVKQKLADLLTRYKSKRQTDAPGVSSNNGGGMQQTSAGITHH